MSFLRRGGEPTEDEPGSSKTRYDFPEDWLSLELSSPARASVVETPRLLLVADDYESSPLASPRSFPLMAIPQPPPEVISSNLTPSPRSFSIVDARKKAKRESSFGPSKASPASDTSDGNQIVRAREGMSGRLSTSPGSTPIGGLNEVNKECSSSPSTSPGSIPIVGLSRAKRKFNSSPCTSPGSIPIAKLSSGHSSPSHAAIIAALNRQREWSSRLNTLPGSNAVAGLNKVKQKTPPKQTMEVTVLEPPASTSNSIYKRQQNLERRKWYNEVDDLLPNDVLVVTSTGWTPEYPPPIQDEEELLRKAKGNAGAVTKGPPVRVGSAYHAIEEIYTKRLDAEAYAKYGLFHNVESLWFRKYSKGGPPSRPVAKERKPYAKATLVSRRKS